MINIRKLMMGGVFASLLSSTALRAEEMSIDKAIDGFFTEYLGWFANAIFYGMPVQDGVTFPLIVG